MGYGRTGRVPIWDPPVRNVAMNPPVRETGPRYVATDACEQETDPDMLLNYGPRPYESDFLEEDDIDDDPFPFPVPVSRRRRRRRVPDFFEEDDIHCDPAHHERGCRECLNCEGGQPGLIPAEEIIAHQQARLAAAARQAQIANLRTHEEALQGRPPRVASIANLDRELARRRRVRISNDLEFDPYYRQERRRSPYRYTQDELYFSDDEDSHLSFGNRNPHERLLVGPPLRRALLGGSWMTTELLGVWASAHIFRCRLLL
jgi:hypothetical protein